LADSRREVFGRERRDDGSLRVATAYALDNTLSRFDRAFQEEAPGENLVRGIPTETAHEPYKDIVSPPRCPVFNHRWFVPKVAYTAILRAIEGARVGKFALDPLFPLSVIP
jgi:hypothetical protein